MKIDTYYKAKAEEIHKTCPVVDTHLDLAGELVFRLRNGEENPLRDIYLPAFRKGGFDLIVSSVYLQNNELPEECLWMSVISMMMGLKIFGKQQSGHLWQPIPTAERWPFTIVI